MVIETELLPEYEIPNRYKLRSLVCSDLAEGMSKGYKMFELVNDNYIYDILADCAKHELIRMIRDIYLWPKWNVYKTQFYEKYDYDKCFVMTKGDVDRIASKYFTVYSLYSPELKRCRVFVELYISEDAMDKTFKNLVLVLNKIIYYNIYKNSNRFNVIGGGYMEFSEKYKPKTIHDGLIENGEIVGYCHLYKHPGYLLSKHIKSHDCLKKGCPWLEKNLDSEYFKSRQLVKERKQISDRLMNLWLNHYISQRTYDLWRNKLKTVSTLEDLQKFKDNKIPVEITISDLMVDSVTFDITSDRK